MKMWTMHTPSKRIYLSIQCNINVARSFRVPLLDILQSVPILGFISVTVVFFMSLTPGRVLGAEFAAVFAIFTGPAWNMAFSFHQSPRTVPVELLEASRVFRLSRWMQFWRVEAPFAMPRLIWNMMISMSRNSGVRAVKRGGESGCCSLPF
jgi:NitT/TauT family transport system permease protein